MRSVNLNNKSIQKILDAIVNEIYDENNLNKLLEARAERKCHTIKDYEGYTDEYFYQAKNNYPAEEFGHPTTFSMITTNNSDLFDDLIRRYSKRLQVKLGGTLNALKALYPHGGYIGWHHNGNAPGYNILFSYSLDGQGRFRYYDYDKKDIVSIDDTPGWNVKVGYFPSVKREPERIYWHEADTVNPRLSIAFIVDDRNLWKNMISDITRGEYDKEYIENQGPESDLTSQ